MERQLTILLTLFKPSDEENKYWKEAYLELKKAGYSVHFLSDNPKLEYKNFSFLNKNDWFPSLKNKGKFWLVFNHVDSGQVKTKYFKTVDPDDYISINKLNEIDFNSFDNEILRTKYFKIKDNQFSNQKDIENSIDILPIGSRSTYSTPTTILPTSGIFKRKNKFFNEEIYLNLFEDQILALLCFLEGSKLKEINEVFYLYKENNGISDFKNMILNLHKEYELAFNIYYKIVSITKKRPDTITFHWYSKNIDKVIKYIESQGAVVSKDIKEKFKKTSEEYFKWENL